MVMGSSSSRRIRCGGRGIQSGGRLVQHQDLRLHREHRGNGNAFLLAHAQVVGDTLDIIAHTHDFQRFFDPVATSSAGKPWYKRTKGHVIVILWAKKVDRLGLKNHSHPGAHLAQVLCVQVRPATWTCPLPVKIPLRCRISVDFPAPFGPTRATFSQGWMSTRRYSARCDRLDRRKKGFQHQWNGAFVSLCPKAGMLIPATVRGRRIRQIRKHGPAQRVEVAGRCGFRHHNHGKALPCRCDRCARCRAEINCLPCRL